MDRRLGLILVAKFFIPIFLEKKIFTMPQFLEERFDKRVKTVMAVFWLAVFIFINLTSILYLGALTIEKVMGIPMLYGIIGLAAFAGIYSIYGGLKAVALTDVVQVVFLLAAGWSRPISPSTSSEKVAACTREWSTSMARRAISSI